MSVVTNVILYIDPLEDGDPDEGIMPKPIKAINEWLEDHGKGSFGFIPPAAHCVGGHKALEVDLFLGAFNHLPLDKFLEAVFSQNWEYPANVQVFVKEQEDDKFTVYDTHFRGEVQPKGTQP